MRILHRDDLTEGGFAGLREHRLVKSPEVFGVDANVDGSWPGIGKFVYMADARFMPHGETRMHDHMEVDVISVMVDGRIEHEGSMEHGRNLVRNDVQVQRAGGEGFSHNEINPDDDTNHMIQLWVLPEQAGQAAAYKVYRPSGGAMERIYGGDGYEDDFPAGTLIDIAMPGAGQEIEINAPFLAYLTRGNGSANGEPVKEGDLMGGDELMFKAMDDAQLIVVRTRPAPAFY